MSGATPAALGYQMPPEWRRHSATWLAWPKNPITWPDCVSAVEETFVAIVAALAPHETVDLLVDDGAMEQNVRGQLSRVPSKENVVYHRIRTVDSWIRDYGPNFLVSKDGKLAYNDWIFNAWGNKYEDLKEDNSIPARLQDWLHIPRFEPGIVLEGGSIDVDGAGVCMATEQCLHNSNRNPHLGRKEIEHYLKEFLGVEKILWLGDGVAGDDTDGHIDDVARFVSATTIVCATEEDPGDPNYRLLRENYQRLQRATNVSGTAYYIVPLPMPAIVMGDQQRLPASYCNFYIANGVVLVPMFGHANDVGAIHIFEKLFPDRSIIGIDCQALLWGMGAIHCVTQQQPWALVEKGMQPAAIR
ncbi:MAG: agmatine deiminase family protein [Acidobacteria bacterium]|nr:agmatine deiminase family protein [Acidobacteriota bacterium]